MTIIALSKKFTESAMQPLIARHILSMRSQRVMLDSELAALYWVETKVLVQAVKRNLERFPADFMFQLSSDEYAALRSQFVTSNVGRGGRRYTPYAFTEQGVAILSSVLSSARAIVINVEIMRAFVQVRAMAATHEDVANQLATSSGPWALALRQLEVAVCDLKFEGALGLRQFTILSIANYWISTSEKCSNFFQNAEP